jgi:hypothetical protein
MQAVMSCGLSSSPASLSLSLRYAYKVTALGTGARSFTVVDISFGTSLDGYNLHKGNNPTFLEHYPPPFNMNIDPFYADIGVGHHYKSESDFDAGQKNEAVQYMKAHPRATIIALG